MSRRKSTGRKKAYQPCAEHRELVQGLAACGLDIEEIAQELRQSEGGAAISVAEVIRHYGRAIAAAPRLARARVLHMLYRHATESRKATPTAAKYWIEQIEKLHQAGEERDGMRHGRITEDSTGLPCRAPDKLTEDERMERLMVLYDRIRTRLLHKLGDSADPAEADLDTDPGAATDGAQSSG